MTDDRLADTASCLKRDRYYGRLKKQTSQSETGTCLMADCYNTNLLDSLIPNSLNASITTSCAVVSCQNTPGAINTSTTVRRKVLLSVPAKFLVKNQSCFDTVVVLENMVTYSI